MTVVVRARVVVRATEGSRVVVRESTLVSSSAVSMAAWASTGFMAVMLSCSSPTITSVSPSFCRPPL